MPSSSAKQSRFMAAIAHNPSFAKKVGVSQSVGKDFAAADKGKTFNKGGMMKMRKFAGEESSYVDDDVEPNVERKSFASGVSAEDREYRESAPKKETSKKAAAKRNLDSAGSSKVSPAQETVLPRMERDKAASKPAVRAETIVPGFAADISKKMERKAVAEPRGPTKQTPTEDSDRADGVAHGSVKKKKTFGDFLEEVRSYKSTRGMKKGGAVMKEPKDAMMPRRPRGMTPPVAPQSPMGMGMKKGGMPMKDGKPAFMKKFAKGGGIESRGKTKGTVIRMASGGSVSSASRRADGIAQRGKTRC